MIRSIGTLEPVMSKDAMAKRQKTAPELERLILLEMRRHAVCAGVAAVTVRETTDRAGTNWTVAHINALGGTVPAPCQNICLAAAAKLQQEYELLPEFELDMDF
jgi:Mn-containing catalase